MGAPSLLACRPEGHRPLRALAQPSDLFRDFGPNWYAAVMGTSITATAGFTLPVHLPGIATGSTALWALSVLMLLGVGGARTVHLLRHRDRARAQLLDPGMAPFYGCLSMALMSVGAATLIIGQRVIGTSAAVGVDTALWLAGTVIGVLVMVVVPALMLTRYDADERTLYPTWLLPVVALYVSASLGPLLLPHLPDGQWRAAMLILCCAMLGMVMLATLMMLPVIWARLLRHSLGPAHMAPTLFLVLGPLGQSVTAVAKIADLAKGTLPEPYATGLRGMAMVYGVPVLGAALFWILLSGALVLRTARRGMPFALTWWAFTFPLGTCVTGATAVAQHTHLAAARWLAAGLYALLTALWTLVAVRTARAAWTGRAFLPPQTART
ncbi:TDT family transporter [Streptomyces monticola]|uniref:TDT family transporter n=1 Tax=Streptomyces monticola TaxID=2666263 RepID=A0ABW2JTH4_9ACTN